MNARQQRGLAIAATSNIIKKGDVWFVPSQHGGKTYCVDLKPEPPICTCPDYSARKDKCKHIFAVEQWINPAPEPLLPAPILISSTRPTHKQEWTSYNLAQTREKSLFQSLLYELCKNVDELPQPMGRPRIKLRDLIFCMGVKVYECLSGRRNMTDLREAQQRGYISKAVHYNTISKYLDDMSMTTILRDLITRSSLPLKCVEQDLAVDSTGISTCRFVRWFDVKYGNTEDWHDWIKLHLICGTRTHIVIGTEVSGRYANDSPFFKPLVEKAATSGFNIKEVSADKEYLSDENIRFVLLKGGQPYIPFKSNSVASGKSNVWDKMLHYYNFNLEEFNRHYHKRSNVETTFSMIKAKFGERLRSRTQTAQFNEALCKVLCHNLCVLIQSMYELGIDVSLWSESSIDHNVE